MRPLDSNKEEIGFGALKIHFKKNKKIKINKNTFQKEENHLEE